MDAPEKIWCKPNSESWGLYGHWYRDSAGGGTEYTRTDRANELVAAAYEAAAKRICPECRMCDHPRYCSASCALLRTLTPAAAVAALAARDARIREAALREAADICTNVIKNYDVMEPGKPDQYANLKMQKAAKGMVSLVRQDIEVLIAKDKALAGDEGKR